MKKKLLDFLIKRILTPFAYGYMHFVAWTSHWRIINRRQLDEIKNDDENVIFAFWHNQLVLMPYWYKNNFPNKELSVLISKSKDGDYLREVVEYFKFDTVRGSTSKGGDVALRALMEKVNKGFMIGITPDGPRGPRYIVQKGVIKLAQATGCRIVPVAYDTSWKVILRTWDRLKVPLPMGNVYCIFGKPLTISTSSQKNNLEEKRIRLEEELNRINKEVARRVAWWVGVKEKIEDRRRILKDRRKGVGDRRQGLKNRRQMTRTTSVGAQEPERRFGPGNRRQGPEDRRNDKEDRRQKIETKK